MTVKEIKLKEQILIKFIKENLPEGFKAGEAKNTNAVILHQDAFAADYQDTEYYLLGAYIKYLGLKGKEVRIMGKNRDTLK